MNAIYDRLKEAREKAGYETAADAAGAFGWPYPTYAAHENGSRGFRAETAQRYAKAFRVTAHWLLYGDENIDRVEDGEPAPSNAALVPVYDVAASAGNGTVVEYEAEIYSLAFPPDYLKKLTSSSPTNLAIISVKGDSMDPTLVDDDVVLLDTSKTNLSFDGLFVIRFDDALHVKRVGRSAKPGHVTIISDNTAFRDIEASKGDLNVVGKVLWYGRKV
ncbi:LexA family transcriptional regulator [Pontibaca salina]|uniref:Helix-turn-helix transcriptional regulator n=1 Tax=Pontibaca salina TaxID=2795731 RepID=A0A934LX94_9RHOB|nr:XRE family transcriptional regulator [Pontibaca salina]MBI6628347.1 helix-turn-helix transcriptional regulator [Pontibaca salina]